MSEMFYGCESLQSLDLSNLNTQNVTNMSEMFYGCNSLVALDLSNLNTKNVTNMWRMFSECWNLSKIDIRHFDMTQVSCVAAMCHGCRSLFEINLNKEARQRINTRPEIETTNIFKGCQSLSSLPDILLLNQNVDGDAEDCINALNK